MTFTGFPVEALDFYDDLEMDNTRSYWDAHKPTYLESVRAPMTALTEALAPEFGPAKIFRPHRDTRFAKDKSTVNAPTLTSGSADVRIAHGTPTDAAGRKRKGGSLRAVELSRSNVRS